MTERLYIITRRDISPGYQAVQSCHAMRQFTAEHPELDVQWFEESNTLCLLSVKNEKELIRMIHRAEAQEIAWSAFHEPDIGNRITAIALGPGDPSTRLCSGLPLTLEGGVQPSGP